MIHKSVLEFTRHLPMVSLQQMSLLKIVTSLCNNRQLNELILKCELERKYFFRLSAKMGEEWEEIEEMASELISEICNSDILRKKILDLLWLASYRILVWRSIYGSYIDAEFLDHFYWTDRGRIDNVRTAKYLIGNKNIPANDRFFLACSLCLGEEIKEIWAEMGDNEKFYFLVEKRYQLPALYIFWVQSLEGSNDAIGANMHDSLAFASTVGLLEAVKYLFSISAEDKRKEMADVCMDALLKKLERDFFLEEDQNDLAYFVFFEMLPEKQDQIFNTCSELIISLLLHSNDYKLCLDLVVDRSPSSPGHVSGKFLSSVFFCYHLELANDDCKKLFIEVWRAIPTSIKNTFTNLGMILVCSLIRDEFPFLLETEEIKNGDESFVLNFKSAVSEERFILNKEKWNLLHFLIEEEVVTIQRLEMNRMDTMYYMRVSLRRTIAWNRVFTFVRNVGTLQ